MGGTLTNVWGVEATRVPIEHIADDGVLFVEEEFCQVGCDLEARALHLASVLEHYLESLEHTYGVGCAKQGGFAYAPGAKKLMVELGDTIVRLREAGLILEEACVAYVNSVDRADRRLTRDSVSVL
jgi:hypothetical protein